MGLNMIGRFWKIFEDFGCFWRLFWTILGDFGGKMFWIMSVRIYMGLNMIGRFGRCWKMVEQDWRTLGDVGGKKPKP